MMKLKRSLTRYDRLINYFYEANKKSVDIVKNKIMRLFKTGKDYSKKCKERNQENN